MSAAGTQVQRFHFLQHHLCLLAQFGRLAGAHRLAQFGDSGLHARRVTKVDRAQAERK